MRHPPFVVFSLPRSRSAWLSVFLGAPDAPVGHDIGCTVDSMAEFASKLKGDLAGTCETGAAFAWRAICVAVPDGMRFMVVRRSPAAVCASLARFGLTGFEDEIARRDAQLDEIAALPGVLSLDFEDLAHSEACAAAYRHCLGREMPVAWWRSLDPINVQVDMGRQLQLLTARRAQIEALKAEAEALSNRA